MTMHIEGRRRSHASGHLFVGGMLILLGGLFLADTLGIADTGHVISTWWPLILIGIGISRIVSADSSPDRVGGGIWILAGALFLLSRLGYMTVDIWRLFWPIALISFGVMLVMRSRNRVNIPMNSATTIHGTALLSGVERKLNTQQFEGGELTAVMGGCQIDLREAGIQNGEPPVIDLFVLMGGIELFIPQDWVVVSKVTPIMAGFEDKTNPSKDASKRIVIRGMVVMGGVEVRNS